MVDPPASAAMAVPVHKGPIQAGRTAMAGEKTAHSFDLVDDQAAFLTEMATSYDLPDAGKALRVLIDYAMHEGDRDAIFTEIRCLRCG